MIARVLLLAATAALASCSEIFPEEEVKFDLVEFTTGSGGKPAITLRARNTGDIDVYNVACDAYAVSGSRIVDTAFLYFANGGTIRTGQSTEETGTWFDLTSSTQFQSARWDCSFLLRD